MLKAIIDNIENDAKIDIIVGNNTYIIYGVSEIEMTYEKGICLYTIIGDRGPCELGKQRVKQRVFTVDQYTKSITYTCSYKDIVVKFYETDINKINILRKTKTPTIHNIYS